MVSVDPYWGFPREFPKSIPLPANSWTRVGAGQAFCHFLLLSLFPLLFLLAQRADGGVLKPVIDFPRWLGAVFSRF